MRNANIYADLQNDRCRISPYNIGYTMYYVSLQATAEATETTRAIHARTSRIRNNRCLLQNSKPYDITVSNACIHLSNKRHSIRQKRISLPHNKWNEHCVIINIATTETNKPNVTTKVNEGYHKRSQSITAIKVISHPLCFFAKNLLRLCGSMYLMVYHS